MMKLHIQDVEGGSLHPSKNPGAGQYEATPGFGTLGLKKSFHKKLGYHELPLRLQKNLPGPGSYQHPNVLGQNITNSTKQNSHGQAIAKAKDRFWTPANRKTEPGAGQYNP